MDIRTLQSLQQALPILLRHLSAYLELAEQDLAEAKIAAAARLRLLVIFVVGGLFALLMICVFVIALTWDGHKRLLAIGLMAGAFILLTIVSGTHLNRRLATKAFAGIRREWQEDRAMVYRLLSDKQDTNYADATYYRRSYR